MTMFSFWFRLENLCYRMAKYCHGKRDEAYDRFLDKEIRRLRK